jgi:membrane protease YdiL (CAAX protease family)
MGKVAPTTGAVDPLRTHSSALRVEEPTPFSPAERWSAPLYFLVYLVYLFWHRESEALHWVSLVFAPFALVVFLNRKRANPLTFSLAGFGFRRGNLTRGLGLTLILGTVLGVFQVFFSRSGPAVLEAFANGKALYLLPLAFVFVLFTAGFTEEVFFRGFLQTRLEALLGSKWGALIVTSLCFGLYHLPYAYFNPNWPSAGDWGAAWGSALGQGVPGGLVLGGVYLVARKNLLACILLHALIIAFPAMGMIRFSGP